MQITITEDVRKELDKLATKHGYINEDIVVAASRRKTSPLHPLFLWERESEAAQIGRREIARQLIMRVRITHEEAEAYNFTVGIRKYFGQVGGGYYPLQTVMTRKEIRERLLQAALRDLMAWKKKYAELKALHEVFAAADRAQARLLAAKRKGAHRKDLVTT